MRVFILLPVMLMFVGCSGSTEPAQPGAPIENASPGYTYFDTYLPFVEEVKLPDVIHEGEEIAVVLKLSFPLRDEIGIKGYEFLVAYTYTGGDYVTGYALDNWMYDQPLVEPRGDTYVRVLPPLPEGTWVLRIWSARTREEGGTFGLYEITPGVFPLNREAMTYTDYELNVLPR